MQNKETTAEDIQRDARGLEQMLIAYFGPKAAAAVVDSMAFLVTEAESSTNEHARSAVERGRKAFHDLNGGVN